MFAIWTQRTPTYKVIGGCFDSSSERNWGQVSFVSLVRRGIAFSSGNFRSLTWLFWILYIWMHVNENIVYLLLIFFWMWPFPPEQVPSHILMGIPHSASLYPLSPLGEACSRMDLTAIHEILDSVGYKDDEGMTNEVRIITYAKFSC